MSLLSLPTSLPTFQPVSMAAGDDPILPRFELGRRIEKGFEWVEDHWGTFFDKVKENLNDWVERLSARLISPTENLDLGLSLAGLLILVLIGLAIFAYIRGRALPAIAGVVAAIAVLFIPGLDPGLFSIALVGEAAPAIVLGAIAIISGLQSRFVLSVVAAAAMAGVFFVPAADYPLSITVVGALLAWLVGNLLLGVVSWLLLAFIITVDQWDNAMTTLAMVLVATVIALAIGIPIGIIAAKSRHFSSVVRPVLDLMQTMPAFVWLIPVVTLLSIGYAAGVVATIIFCLPPAVRLTELGIRQVDGETVEAGQAFGATGMQILREIQVPLAMPTIMAGVNQVIMLALSMAVISGLVGAGGLGGEVTSAISTVNIGLGFEAGLAVVALAIYLDRATAAIASTKRLRPASSAMSKVVKNRLAVSKAKNKSQATTAASGGVA